MVPIDLDRDHLVRNAPVWLDAAGNGLHRSGMVGGGSSDHPIEHFRTVKEQKLMSSPGPPMTDKEIEEAWKLLCQREELKLAKAIEMALTVLIILLIKNYL